MLHSATQESRMLDDVRAVPGWIVQIIKQVVSA
jgi:hypothetical protein